MPTLPDIAVDVQTMAISNFATEVLADGPIGYWRLGEALGSVVASDASGNGNSGSSSGAISFGQPGFHCGDTAALFDGTTGRIIVPNSNSLNPPHITMEAKVRWDGPNGLYQRILEKSSFAELAQYGFGILPDGHVRVELRTSSATTSVNVDSVGVASQGVETHIVATYDGDVIRVYLNGILDSETRAPGSISPKPPTPLNLTESGVGIGNQTQRDRGFKGLIDELALYPTALSAERVLAHYQARFAQRLGFGNLIDGQHLIWIADFTGTGHAQVMVYYAGDGNWWLGDMVGGQLQWSLVSQTC